MEENKESTQSIDLSEMSKALKWRKDTFSISDAGTMEHLPAKE